MVRWWPVAGLCVAGAAAVACFASEAGGRPAPAADDARASLCGRWLRRERGCVGELRLSLSLLTRHACERRLQPVRFLQIGANDGGARLPADQLSALRRHDPQRPNQTAVWAGADPIVEFTLYGYWAGMLLEPVASSFNALTQFHRAEAVHPQRLRHLRAAVGKKDEGAPDGYTRFWVPVTHGGGVSEFARLHVESNDTLRNVMTQVAVPLVSPVEAHRAAAAAAGGAPDVVVIDTEGSDEYVLSELLRRLADAELPDLFVFEYHMLPCGGAKRLWEQLSQRGYAVRRVTNLDATAVKRQGAVERAAAEFQRGGEPCSGPEHPEWLLTPGCPETKPHPAERRM